MACLTSQRPLASSRILRSANRSLSRKALMISLTRAASAEASNPTLTLIVVHPNSVSARKLATYASSMSPIMAFTRMFAPRGEFALHESRFERRLQPQCVLRPRVVGEWTEFPPASWSRNQYALAGAQSSKLLAQPKREGFEIREICGHGPYGRLGKRPKSGWRFSLNASRPSCASSVM